MKMVSAAAGVHYTLHNAAKNKPFKDDKVKALLLTGMRKRAGAEWERS